MSKRDKRILEGYISDIEIREIRLSLRILTDLVNNIEEEIRDLEIDIEQIKEEITDNE